MTNALIQNIETEKNATFDILAQAVSTTSTKTEDNSKYSNFASNLEARFNKAQNNFEKKAQVTNTSSINKKALDNSKEVNKEVNKEAVKENNVNEISKNPKETSISKEQTNTKKENLTTSENSPKVNKEPKKEVVSQDKKENTNETTSKNDLSDINNSSPVESSPVFSSDKVELNESTKEEIESAIEEIDSTIQMLAEITPIVDETLKLENQDLKTKLEDLMNNLENTDESSQTIEEITSTLDNSNLNQDLKEEIKTILENLKSTLGNNSESKEIAQNFDETFANTTKEEIKNVLSVLEADKNNNLNTETNESTENTNDFKNIKDTLESIAKDIKNSIDSKDYEKLNQVIKQIPETIKEIKNSIENNENLKIDVEENLVKPLKKLEKNLQSLTNENEVIEFKNVNLDDLKKLDLSDENTMNKILNVLENLNSKLDTNTNEEIKTQLEDLIKKINDKTISNEELTQAIDNISDEIKVDNKIELDNETFEIKPLKTEKVTIENQDSFDDFSNNEEYKQTYEDDFNKDNVTDVDFEPEVQLKATATKEIDIQNVEENLQKTVAINEMLDEMMVEVDIKTIPTQSGALSVADEVAKLAMGETNTLNSITSSGSIAYDSTGANVVIKNAANLIKSAQVQTPSETPSMEDVLNQLSNKITQLKDGVNQKLTMVLRPHDLGRLSIELTTNQNGLMTQIIAQNDDVRAYIEKNIDSLRTQLADSGVNVNSIQIKTAGSESSTTYDGNQNLSQQQEEMHQQNSKENNEQKQKENNKQEKEFLANMSNYDMQFAKDFSSVLNKTLNYSLN